MNLLRLIMFSIMGVASTRIRPCYTCKHYLPSTVGGKYDIGSYLGKCSKFEFIEDDTKELNYLYTIMARTYEHRCGKEGKYYEKSDNLSIKMNNFE